MPDSVGFYDHLSGVANLRYSAALCGMKPADADARIDAALKRVRLEAAGGKPVRGYSRGMRQRLAIAEILMKGAAIAILDEPTGGLDPQSTREFLELIHSLKQEGMTILLSSHLLDLVQSICDRVALFHRGRIGLTGRVDDLLQRRARRLAGDPRRSARSRARRRRLRRVRRRHAGEPRRRTGSASRRAATRAPRWRERSSKRAAS